MVLRRNLPSSEKTCIVSRTLAYWGLGDIPNLQQWRVEKWKGEKHLHLHDCLMIWFWYVCSESDLEATREDGHSPPSPLPRRSEESLLDSVRPHVYEKERFVNDTPRTHSQGCYCTRRLEQNLPLTEQLTESIEIYLLQIALMAQGYSTTDSGPFTSQGHQLECIRSFSSWRFVRTKINTLQVNSSNHSTGTHYWPPVQYRSPKAGARYGMSWGFKNDLWRPPTGLEQTWAEISLVFHHYQSGAALTS